MPKKSHKEVLQNRFLNEKLLKMWTEKLDRSRTVWRIPPAFEWVKIILFLTFRFAIHGSILQKFSMKIEIQSPKKPMAFS